VLFVRYSSHWYWILAFLLVIFHTQLNEAGITTTECFITFAAGAVFRLVIAVRYASLTIEEYMDFLQEPDIAVATELRNQMQLLTGWMQVCKFLPGCINSL
jgi:hypothetical protein